MMLFVFVVATLNLAVGYAIGAKLTVGDVLARLPLPRRGAAPIEEVTGDDLLTRPVEAPVEAAGDVESPAPESPLSKSPGTSDVLEGLASFREKLATASVELNLSQEDPQRFDDCASRLQEANHGYVDQATAAADELKQRGEEGDATAAAAGDAIAEGVEGAEKISRQFDALMESEMNDEARAGLIKAAAAMKDSATQVQLNAESAIDEAATAEDAEPDPSDTADAAESDAADKAPAERLKGIGVDELFDQLEQALESADEERPCMVGAVTADPIEGRETDTALYTALTRQVDELIDELLDDGHCYAAGSSSAAGRPILSFGSDSFTEASRKIEQIRQSFEATTFEWGGETVRTTVTCAMVEAKSGDDRGKVETYLTAALNESDRVGNNRTFHHDGAFPTPLPAIPLEPVRRAVQLN